MIECGWCGAATKPGACSTCGRDPALPWQQRAQDPPGFTARDAGRPNLDASQVRQRIRIARKEHPDATNAELAEYLGISARTLGRWQMLADSGQ
jgi:hypothetical protein